MTKVYESNRPEVGQLTIDREARVIRGVKVLGLRSRNIGRTIGLPRSEFGEAVDNPYRYAAEAVEKAIPLYENASVNMDHPDTVRGHDGGRTVASSRKVAGRFGRLINVRADETGLVADLQYAASHKDAELVLEFAERMPEQLAFSHLADARFELIGGEAVAVEIRDVDSVDLIATKPGTTKTMFESFDKESDMPKTTLREVAEAHKKLDAGKALIKAIEEYDLDGGAMATEVADDSTPGDKIKGAFRDAIMQILDDDAIDTAETIKRIGALLKTRDKVMGDGSLDGTVEEPDATDEEAKTTEESLKKTAEQLAKTEAELKTLKLRTTARELLESKGVKVSEARIDAVAAQPTDAKRLAVVMEFLDTSGISPLRARSSMPVRESRDASEKIDGKAFADAHRH